MRLSSKLAIAGIIASILMLGMPIVTSTSSQGRTTGVAFADSRDTGHAKHDRGQDSTGSGY